MSKEEYVQIEAVRQALEKVVKDENAIEKVLTLLSDSTVAVDTAKQAEPELEDNTSGEPDGEEDAPKPKMQYVILVSDSTGVINKDLVGWVLQVPEEEDCREVVEGIKKAAYNFNASKKGRKYPVNSIGQAIEGVPTKFFKPYNIKLKTKESVYVVTTDNVLPKS
jgi:hypothetical protein